MRVVVLGSCDIRDDWAPPGAVTYDKIVATMLRNQGHNPEVTSLSMTPARYVYLDNEPFTRQPFDYLAMEVTSSWLTVRTITRSVARMAPRPIKRAFVGVSQNLTHLAGGPQDVWLRKTPTLRGRALRFVRSCLAAVIPRTPSPRPMSSRSSCSRRHASAAKGAPA